ncbi:4-hydroxy-tetrahydrodipicolinate synthase [Solwaraspora sp. WMMD937]|uniref:4-hydroxy-tetrahydrodipicolinate synthase n=1 Tax=Solwaraspora sp. WMMD937 TaxID=3016090 RepID=UPI00249BD596|nr:4-hydroxy-tetrahydrodipicolinate synthase [Solwaraspora sp. WMMD937]WFE19957.1 4-hydroxy-tetrahydrodipicolinate synthase [Solwaraspora sp. WMMD937]
MRWRNNPADLRGSIAALVTPFTDDGDLDLESLHRLVRHQLAHGSHGISIGGSTGEPSAQTLAERATAIRAVGRAVADRAYFVPGTGSAKLDETLELTAVAAEAGADAVLVITPYYARPTQEALFHWYRTIAQEFPDMPIIAYNVPGRTAVDLAPETVQRLYTEIDNFVGVKETTTDFQHFSRVIRLCGPDLLVWSGIELLCLPLLAIGGAGFISATANLAPAAHVELYQAWVQGDQATAQRIHYGMHPLVDLLFVETNPAPSKWVLHQLGLLDSPRVRPPLIEPTPAAVERISELLAEGAVLVSPTSADVRPSGTDIGTAAAEVRPGTADAKVSAP